MPDGAVRAVFALKTLDAIETGIVGLTAEGIIGRYEQSTKAGNAPPGRCTSIWQLMPGTSEKITGIVLSNTDSLTGLELWIMPRCSGLQTILVPAVVFNTGTGQDNLPAEAHNQQCLDAPGKTAEYSRDKCLAAYGD